MGWSWQNWVLALLAGLSLAAAAIAPGVADYWPAMVLLLAVAAFARKRRPPVTAPVLIPPGLACRAMDAVFEDAHSPDPACLILLAEGRPAPDAGQLAAALLPVLRTTDVLSPVEGGIAVTFAPMGRLDLETMIPIAVRLQRAVLAMRAKSLAVAVGFCLPDQARARSGQAMMHGARLAAEEARRHGPGAIRSFRPDLARDPTPPPRTHLAAALDAGQFVPHFQPQICARTGTLTGAEVLARWHHPDHGLLVPAAFLDDLRRAGLSSRLTMAMLSQAMSDLRQWDAAGLTVPSVAINLDAQDLADPMLPDHIAWAMDRHDMPPHRLTAEVMETVLADGDPVTVRNIDRLARMGCGVDLDDFGTGQAAIGQLRRLTIRRIKIDRSFTDGLDSDADQRRVVTAILLMADRLGLDTLAEGVESPEQAATLAAMGCGHLQGWAIAHPMPAATFAAWLASGQRVQTVPPGKTGGTAGLQAAISAGPVTPV